ncbi:MAG: MATE family efflux transporter [Erysipelotrichaceae bacterium]|nr:MATE family efflux transporter [Erysipelotrichaceae bacterium]MBR3693723.1 MATE family efflux transporter [Erysipelotrichales bacterium]
MLQTMKNWLFDKDFYKQVLVIAIPLMVQQVIMSSVNLIDNLMVGQLGDATIGGVGVVNRYYMIANFGANGFVASACIFIAQYFGAKDFKRLKQTFSLGIFGTYVIIIPFTLLALLAPDVILYFFTDDVAYVAQGIHYLEVVAYSFLPAALTMIIAGTMRSCGEIKVPLFANILAVFTNAILNYIFIFGKFGAPAMGVVGAALATLISRIIEAIILLVFVKLRDYDFKVSLNRLFDIPRELIKKVTLKAIPLVTNEVLWGSGMAMLLKLYATRGADVITAYSVAGTTSDIFYSLFNGMAGATTIIVGQKLGANKLEEARKNGYQMILFSTMLAVLFGIMMFGASFIVPGLYDLTPHTKELATNLIRVLSVLFWIFMINAECYFIMRAGGDTKNTFLMDSCFMWLVNIPIVASVAYLTDLNIYYVYTIAQLTDLLKMALSFYMIRKEGWVRNLTEMSHEL